MKRKVVISEFPVGYTGRHPHDIYGGHSGRKLVMKKTSNLRSIIRLKIMITPNSNSEITQK